MFAMRGPMPLDLETELFAAARRDGVPPAKWLRAALDTLRRHPVPVVAIEPPGGRAPRSQPRSNAVQRSIRNECPDCFGEAGGAGATRCKCYDTPPALTPGAKPFAAEAANFHPAGWAVGHKLAHKAFAPYELSLIRNSIATHGGAAVVFLNGKVDGSSTFHLCRMMDAARTVGAKAIVLDIRSEGGNVPAGLVVVRALERLRKEHVPTVAVISHQADSMASVIAVSAAYAVMAPEARMCIHEASGGDPAHLEILRAKLLDIYAARTLTDRAKLEGYLAGAVTLDACSAHSHGFVDEVAGPDRMEAVARAAARGLYSQAIMAANSWRRHVLRERQADADGVVRWNR